MGKELIVTAMKGAIFDVDGTILDSMTVWEQLTFGFFAELGVQLTDVDMSKSASMTVKECLIALCKQYNIQMTIEEISNELLRRAEEMYKNTIPPKDGVCEYMHRLHNNGIKIAIATSGYMHLCRPALERIGVLDIIDVFTFSSEVGCNKSKPDIYLLAAERLGLHPSDCTVYEDILSGIESAKSAGFNTVAIADKTNAPYKDRLIRQSDHYITGWKELLSNINGDG